MNVTCIVIILIIILIIPVIYGSLNTPDGKKFLGVTTAILPDEAYYYLALGPAQAVKGTFLFKDPLGRAGNQKIFFNPIGHAIGAISSIAHVSISDAFIVFRIISSVFLLLCFAFLARQFISSPFTLAAAIFVFAFGAGFGYVFEILGISSVDPIDDAVPEINMFISMCGEYYLPLANALFILTLAYAYQTLFKKRPKTIQTGIALFVLGTIYVYGMVAASIIIVVSSVIEASIGNERKAPIMRAIKICLFCVPVVAYYPPALAQASACAFHPIASAISSSELIPTK